MTTQHDERAELPPLPEIDPHSHPEPRSFKWTENEIDWIKEYAHKYARAALLAADSRAGGEVVESGLICPRCKVDRLKTGCPNNNFNCPMKGEAYQANSGMPAECSTGGECKKHGCHGECLPDEYTHPAPAEPQAVAQGWKLVPLEPTREMLNAAIDVDGFRLGDISPLGFRCSPQQLFEKCYAAMISASPAAPAEREPLTDSDDLQVVTAERDFWKQVANKHRATIAGLESSVFHLSRMFDEQIQMLVEVEKQLCLDGHYGPFEDGEHALCDRIRSHIAAHHIGKPNDVGINGLTEAETAASASVMGLTSKNKEQEK